MGEGRGEGILKKRGGMCGGGWAGGWGQLLAAGLGRGGALALAGSELGLGGEGHPPHHGLALLEHELEAAAHASG